MSKIAQSPIREDRRWFIVGVASFLYFLSFALPVTKHSNDNYPKIDMSGLDAFRVSWQALVDPAPNELDWWIFGTVWLANPAIWLSILCVMNRAWMLSLISSGSAILLSLPILFRVGTLIAPFPGYWIWLASGLFLFACSFKMWISIRIASKQSNHI